MTTSPQLAPIEVRILVLLTFTAGIYDATTFLALDRVFVAIVTGNIILIGVSLASSEMTLAGPIIALIAFVVGAAITGRLDSAGADRWLLLRRTVVVESVMLVPAIALAISYDGEEIRRLLILALLAAAMGCRNATIRQVGVPELQTTVQTMTLATLASEEARGAGMRVEDKWRLAGIAALVAGAVIGGFLAVETSLAFVLALLFAIHLGAALLLARRRPAGAAV